MRFATGETTGSEKKLTIPRNGCSGLAGGTGGKPWPVAPPIPRKGKRHREFI